MPADTASAAANSNQRPTPLANTFLPTKQQLTVGRDARGNVSSLPRAGRLRAQACQRSVRGPRSGMLFGMRVDEESTAPGSFVASGLPVPRASNAVTFLVWTVMVALLISGMIAISNGSLP